MATLQQLETALINADKAGDVEAAQILAREIKSMRAFEGTGFGASYRPRTSIDPESPSPAARVGRGFMDIAQGGKQLYLKATDPEAAKQYTQGVDAEIANYEKGRGPNAGFDMLRLGGNVLGSAPITLATMAAAPEAATATLLGRTLLATGQGAVQGATQYAPEGQSKTRQIVAGAGGGVLGSMTGEVLGRAVAKLTQMAQRGATRLTVSPDDVVGAIQGELQSRGIDWNKLGADVRLSLLNQARRQVAVNGDLSPDALARKVQADDVLGPNAGLTVGQLMRENPALWTQERNLQKGEMAFGRQGDPTLTDRYQAQIQKLQQRLEQAVQDARGQAQNEYQAGASALGGVRQKMDASKKVVDDLYAVWRETGQGGTELKPQGIADTLGKVSEEFGIDHINPTVRARLESFGLMGGKQTKVMTIDEAEKLRRLIGNQPMENPTQKKVYGMLRQSIDEAVMGTEAPEIPSLQAARKAAAARFAMRDSAPAVTAAADADTQPDRFFRRFVLNGDVRDLQGLKATLTSDAGGAAPTGQTEQAWRDLQAQTLKHLMEKATGDRGDTFSGRAFSKALKEVGDERLKVLFDPEQIASLQKLARVANDVTTEPNFAAVNHSNTAPTMMQYAGDVLKKVASIAALKPVAAPIVGAYAAGERALQNQAMRQKVAQALTGDAIDPTMASEKYADLVRLLARRTAPLGALGGAGAIEAGMQ